MNLYKVITQLEQLNRNLSHEGTQEYQLDEIINWLKEIEQ